MRNLETCCGSYGWNERQKSTTKAQGDIMADKYTFRDFVTGKPRYTQGRFVQWLKGGPLNAWYAVFQNPATALLVPEYLLSKDSKAQLPPHDESPIEQP